MEKISTKGMTREDWLALRRKTIGGSDAAAIVGVSKWATPYSVWADKMGLFPDKPDTEAMRIGRDLEQYVADRWMEATGKKCHRLQAMLYNDRYPFAAANIDRAVTGEKAGLECKTTSAWSAGDFHTGTEFPERYYCQCVHYLAVTGWDRWYLSVIVLGEGHYTYVLERDQDEIDALMAAEEAFWGYVQRGEAPPLDGSVPTTDAIDKIYGEDDGGEISLIGWDYLFEYRDTCKANVESAKEALAGAENTIKEKMGAAAKAVCGPWNVSWKAQERRTFDAKRFAQDNPSIDLAPYYKTSKSRPFKVVKK